MKFLSDKQYSCNHVTLKSIDNLFFFHKLVEVFMGIILIFLTSQSKGFPRKNLIVDFLINHSQQNLQTKT